MNNTIHIDLTPEEVARIVAVTTFIAEQKDISVGRIKYRFGLTDVEYEIMMDLAMPLLRYKSTANQWKRIYTNFLRLLAKLTTKPHDLPPGKRPVMSWADDPVIRLERLEREIKDTYDAVFRSGKPVDAALQTFADDGEEDDDDDTDADA